MQFQLTHLLRGATRSGGGRRATDRFQLTHLLRGATLLLEIQRYRGYIHFNSRTSCEVRQFDALQTQRPSNFNSRTSCEVRPAPIDNAMLSVDFNSRTSCEVRLPGPRRISAQTPFQLTHLLRGATDNVYRGSNDSANFNSRTSCEVRRDEKSNADRPINFNSRTSCEVRPYLSASRCMLPKISTHAPLARCDRNIL